MNDQLQLRDWQQICQRKAACCAGTPEGRQYFVEANRYGMAAERIVSLEESCRVKDAKFASLCKDMDAMAEHVEELKRVIANQRAEFDHAHGESAHMLKTQANELLTQGCLLKEKNAEIERLKSLIPSLRADAKTIPRMPTQTD